jgi:hypothetical protein
LLSSCESIEDTFCTNCISGQSECENPVPICFVQGNNFWQFLRNFPWLPLGAIFHLG